LVFKYKTFIYKKANLYNKFILLGELVMGIKQDLEKLEALFDGFFHWLAGQYDPETGGFFYARSSLNNNVFKPDIESTAQALNILERNNLIEEMPDKMRKKLIEFFQKKQDPHTGYFFDDNPLMQKDEVMVSRAFSYSLGALKKLGGEPLYPVNFYELNVPEFTKSPEAYLEKWKSISLVNSWRGCDLLSSSCIYIDQMPSEKRDAYIQTALSYFNGLQDQKTGLWGEGSLYVRISGTFKMHIFYRRNHIPLPLENKIYQSILECLRTEEAKDMCYIRNPINLLSYLNFTIPSGDMEEIVGITVDNIEKLKRSDGGFSREIDNSPSAPNIAQVKEDEYYPNMPDPVHLSLGLYESDMNASTQATLVRLQLYKLLGIDVKPIRESKLFFDNLRAMNKL